jgi:hypothetical protein
MFRVWHTSARSVRVTQHNTTILIFVREEAATRRKPGQVDPIPATENTRTHARDLVSRPPPHHPWPIIAKPAWATFLLARTHTPNNNNNNIYYIRRARGFAFWPRNDRACQRTPTNVSFPPFLFFRRPPTAITVNYRKRVSIVLVRARVLWAYAKQINRGTPPIEQTNDADECTDVNDYIPLNCDATIPTGNQTIEQW